MKKVILAIGMPGSGKSTLLRDFSIRHSYSYISPDDIRQELTGDAGDQSANEEVWRRAFERLSAAMQNSETVVFDSTMYKLVDRQDAIARSRDFGASQVEGVYFMAPYAVVEERNARRHRIVPETAMLRMHEALTLYPPSVLDGFDSLFVIDTNRAFEETKRELEMCFLKPEFAHTIH